MIVVASAARRARYWARLNPAMSVSAGRNVFNVTGDASLPVRMRLRDVVDLLMDRLEEMLRLEKIADAIKRLVVHQDRAQKGLLRLDIVRCGAVGRRRLPWLFA